MKSYSLAQMVSRNRDGVLGAGADNVPVVSPLTSYEVSGKSGLCQKFLLKGKNFALIFQAAIGR